MSRFRPKRLRLVVSQTTITLSAATLRGQSTSQSGQIVALPPGDLAQALESALAALPSDWVPRGAALTVVLADPLVRLFLVTPPFNSTRFDDLRCAASLRFETLYGASARDWHIAAVWEASSPFLACAIPHKLLALLTSFADTRKLRLERLTPAALEFSSASHAPRSPAASWLLSKCGTHVTLAVRTTNRVRAIRTLTWPEETWQSWDRLLAAMAREAMRLDCLRPELLTGTGDIPSELFANPHPNMTLHRLKAPPRIIVWRSRQLWPAIDLRPGPMVRSKLTVSSLVGASCALVFMIVAAVQFVLLMTQVGDLRSETEHVGRRVAARQRLVDSVPVNPVKTEQIDAVNSAVRQLNLPWHRLLHDIEAATPRDVALLALEPDAKRTSLKGTAEASTAERMLAYITQLKAQRGFDDVLLMRHEINEQDPMKPFRFQFEAHWSEAGK